MLEQSNYANGPESLSEMELTDHLNGLGESLQKKLDEAIEWRASTGIEQEWEQAECAYQGQDDFQDIIRPATLDGPFTTRNPGNNTAPRSRVFLNITGPYTDAAAARIADMILPNEERNFQLKPTPLQDGMDEQDEQAAQQPPMAMGDIAQAAQQVAGQSATAPQAIQGQTGMSQPAPVDPRIKIQADAEQAAELATKQIEDWLVECQWHAEVRKVLEDSARLGTGVLKGPYPVERKGRKAITTADGIEMQEVVKICPASRRVSLWDCFPAAGCGDSIQDGSYFWERDSISIRKLKELGDSDELGYIKSQICKVLDEDPNKVDKNVAPRGARKEAYTKSNYDIWYYYGMLDKDDLVAAGLPDVDIPTHQIAIPAIVTMVNGIVIKAVINPIEDGSFPYDFMPWKRMTGLPYGRGIAWLLLTPQRMINASARTMMENLGLASGPQILVNRGLVRPADGNWQITPRKIWHIVVNADNPGAAPRASDVFSVFNIPTMTQEFMSVIQFAQKLAEDVTGLPQLMQGSQGSAPDTVGGMTILNNNASTVLRRIARSVDSLITEPQIQRYYAYLMMYGEDDKAKKDFQIDARGSTALVERELSNRALIQMGAMVTNPAFGASPARWFEEALKAQKLDPKRIQMTDEEKQRMAQQPPPVNVPLEIAKMNAQSRAQNIQMEIQSKEKLIQMQQQFDNHIEQMQLASKKWIASQDTNLSWQTALMETANREKISIDQAKKELFIATSKLNTQIELSANDRKAPQVATPAFEPIGRAPNGMAFQE